MPVVVEAHFEERMMDLREILAIRPGTVIPLTGLPERVRRPKSTSVPCAERTFVSPIVLWISSLSMTLAMRLHRLHSCARAL
jgi:hypothetical protein